MSPSKHSLLEKVWHVTVLSNFARGYDKYARAYSKAAIPESTFPTRFYLLRESELSIGLQKATKLLDRLSLPGNCLLAMCTCVPSAELRPNLETDWAITSNHRRSESTQWRCSTETPQRIGWNRSASRRLSRVR